MSNNSFDSYQKKFEEILAKTRQCRSHKEKRTDLLDNGFEFFDDDDDSNEIQEENVAQAQNSRQERLLCYFESDCEPSENHLIDFKQEKNSSHPNYPLIRKYFRIGNNQLKRLILFGLNKNPSDAELISDLAFFNNFSVNLSEFIDYCTKAAVSVSNEKIFKRILTDFDWIAREYDYDTYHALISNPKISEQKKTIVKSMQENGLTIDYFS
jgi:hypothetical protein